MSARIRSVSLLKAQFGARILNLLHYDISGIDEQVRRGRLDAGKCSVGATSPWPAKVVQEAPGRDRALPEPRLLATAGEPEARHALCRFLSPILSTLGP
jgi:hypothetical protein